MSRITTGPTVSAEFESLNYGYRPNPEAHADYVEALPYRGFGDTPTGSRYRDDYRNVKETRPWEPLLELFPHWRRGRQGIGDCVSWGWALAILLVLCRLAKRGVISWDVPRDVATEALYGGGRVEARGGRLGGYSDGSYGAAQAKFVTQWGFLFRQDYSQKTGVSEHDLTTYSSKKAKAWGNFGCGGKEDAGRGDGLLDQLAKEYRVEVVPVRSHDEAIAAQQQGFALAVCSGVGFGSETRNADGRVFASGRWAHCMAKDGLRIWSKGRDIRQWQSWGRSAEGPDPTCDDEEILACSYWTVERDCERQFRANDTFAVSAVIGFDEPLFDINDLADGAFD